MARQLDANRWSAAEYKRAVYRALVEAETAPNELMHHEFFSTFAPDLKPTDEIVVHWEDMSAIARLVVRSVDAYSVVVGCESYTKFEPTPVKADLSAEYEIEFKGEVVKWRVIRKSDRQVVNDKMSSKEYATKWLENHIRSLQK